MPTLDRRGQRLAYEVSESGGRTLLLAHNLFCDRSIFDGLIAQLAGRFRIIAVDLRGHGGSREVSRPFTTRDLGDDLAAVLNAVGEERCAVAGVSLGGCAAMELALAYPGRVSALVLLGATARPATLRDRVSNELLAGLVGAVGLRGVFVRGVLPVLFSPTFREEQPSAVDAWAVKVGALDPRGAREAMRAWTRRPPLRDRLGGLRVPTLVIVGEDDPACPPPHGEEIRAAIAGATLERLPRTGHTAPAERPAETARLIEALLGQGLG